MDRRPLPIDARALIAALTAREDGLVGTYLDLQAGTLLRLVDPAVTGRTNDAIEALLDRDPDRYAKVPLYAREYRLMTEFVDTVDDDDLARLLDVALAGRGAFRRFDAVLASRPGESARWDRYRDDALGRWAVAWLRSLGVEPVWDRPIPAEEPPSAPWLVQVALRGEARDTPTELVRVLRTASEAEATTTFLRLARELCEVSREPFRSAAFRGAQRIARSGVELRRDGPTVTIVVRR
ncbi:MAG: UPF0158 family protein [Myxococcota bacterium]